MRRKVRDGWGTLRLLYEVDRPAFLVGTALFMIAAMWVFPEAGAKKGGDGRSK